MREQYTYISQSHGAANSWRRTIIIKIHNKAIMPTQYTVSSSIRNKINILHDLLMHVRLAIYTSTFIFFFTFSIWRSIFRARAPSILAFPCGLRCELCVCVCICVSKMKLMDKINRIIYIPLIATIAITIKLMKVFYAHDGIVCKCSPRKLERHKTIALAVKTCISDRWLL